MSLKKFFMQIVMSELFKCETLKMMDDTTISHYQKIPEKISFLNINKSPIFEKNFLSLETTTTEIFVNDFPSILDFEEPIK
jgi:hypothetical protein